MRQDDWVAQQMAERERKPRLEIAPNRAQLRRKGIGVRHTKGHARMSGRAKSRASFHTLVAVHVFNEAGKVIRKFVVPRENVDPAMLAKNRSDK